jgi:hypothetical protein
LDAQYNKYNADSSSDDYALRLYYYRAASLCNFYQPAVKEGETLHESYSQGQWYLPAEGELARIYWWHRQGYTIPDEEPENFVDKPIFAEAYNQVQTSGNRTFAAYVNTWYWASTEVSYGSSWYLHFYSGLADSYSRYNLSAVCPVAAIEKSKL